MRAGSNPGTCHAFLIVAAQIAAMPKRIKLFQRELRRSRNLTALIFTDSATTECHLQDVSHHGAKVVVEMPSLIPNVCNVERLPFPSGPASSGPQPGSRVSVTVPLQASVSSQS